MKLNVRFKAINCFHLDYVSNHHQRHISANHVGEINECWSVIWRSSKNKQLGAVVFDVDFRPA
jgi:hypothetical protein